MAWDSAFQLSPRSWTITAAQFASTPTPRAAPASAYFSRLQMRSRFSSVGFSLRYLNLRIGRWRQNKIVDVGDNRLERVSRRRRQCFPFVGGAKRGPFLVPVR